MKNTTQIKQQEIIDCISGIVNQRVYDVSFIGGGGNNQIYYFRTNDDEKLIAKFYYYHTSDTRDRALTEFTAMHYLWGKRVRCIPKPIFHHHSQRCVIFEYITGKHLNGDEITKNHIYQTTRFLLKLRQLSSGEDSNIFHPASESCFSVQNLIDCIYRRMDKLSHSIQDVGDRSIIDKFISQRFRPFLENYVERFCTTETVSHCESWQQYTISPADIGFHNTICRDNGELVFIDFEYFGWDDTAKMIADYLLHPGMTLQDEQKSYFVKTLISELPFGEEISTRLPKTYILTALKWCLILLNEFLPLQMKKRMTASKNVFDLESKRQKQFKKSENMLIHAQQTIGNFPFLLN